ncbi:MAG: DNA polymerase III subunit delta [Prevotella sp.]|nr:DNA polymerase III subunit delta [Prevotella sp.]MCR5151737.1 DNA polymerase III subunit delta [Prevotella sp.]
MRYSEVIGQRDTITRLVKLCDEERMPHALLLTGDTGYGKMAIALATASYLLCSNPHDGDSCGECPACKMIRRLEHPDLHFSYPVIRPTGEAAGHKMASDDFAREWKEMLTESPYFSINKWLNAMGAANQQATIGVGEGESLLHKMSLKSSQGGYKLSIIWLPERMNGDCANSLLKLIEEPPSKTVFILCSEKPEMLLETIRSRTQRIDMRSITIPDIKEALMRLRGLEEETAQRVARASDGSWLNATELLNADNENALFLDLFMSLMRLAFKRDIAGLKRWTDNVAAMGREKQRRMLTYFVHMVRENFMYNFGMPELNYMTKEEENFSTRFARFINEANVIEITELFERVMRDIGQNANARMELYDMCLQIIVLLIRK